MNRKKQSSQVEDKTQEKQSSSYSPILKSGIINKKYRSQHGTSVELPAIPEVSSSDEISSIDEETGSKTNITKEHSKSSMLWTLYHNIIDSTIPLESQDIDNEQDRERILKSLLTRILFSSQYKQQSILLVGLRKKAPSIHLELSILLQMQSSPIYPFSFNSFWWILYSSTQRAVVLI